MRLLLACAALVTLAGCGSSASGSPTSVPPTPTSRSIQQWSSAPKMTIDRNARYTAVLATSDGTFTIRLLPKVAPIAVNSFVFLARHHFFDQITFHRIIKDFVIQSGDPTGTGTGGPGYTFKDEPVTMRYTRGTVAMANSGKNTNGSQFFIVVTPPGKVAGLAPSYTIFGQVASGMGVVQKIADTPVGPNAATGELSQPLNPVNLKSVTIQEQR